MARFGQGQGSGSLGLAGDFNGIAARTAVLPAFGTSLRVQRQPLSEATPIPAEAPPAAAPAAPTVESAPEAAPEAAPTVSPEAVPESAAAGQPSTLIVDDSATELQPGQLRKSVFLDQMHRAVCAEAEAALAGTGQSTAGCPYLATWFDYYRGQSNAHIEAALHRYAPESRNARMAAEYIPLVAARVRQGVERWAATGEITGVPEGVPLSIPGVSGLAGAVGAAASGLGSLLFKARDGGARAADDPATVQAQLGSGTPLESSVRGRMEQAFGQSFAHVRTHTDSTARRLSTEQNARAFTVGEHVAFGAGEYRPGSMIGDALVAHELAHVVQQNGAAGTTQTKSAGGASYGALERDADDAAVGAVAALWRGAKADLPDVTRSAAANLRSGLQLQRCKKETCSEGTKSISVDSVRLHGSTGSPTPELANANTVFKPCCVEFTKGKSPSPESKAVTETWLGGDTDAKVAPNCGAVETEEKAMYDNGTASHSLSSRMRVFYVATFSGSAGAGYSVPPYCASGAAAPYANHVVLQNSASGATNPLAHEFGHILLNSGDHQTAPNLMGPSGGTDLTAEQCKTIYNNA